MAAEGLAILRYLRQHQPALKLGMHSNGGARDELYWQELAGLVSYCRFGIDGLADTNHLYRQGVKWERLERNVRAFVRAGGYAEWDFLVFRHNEHQVEQAQALAKQWGVESFSVKNTSRFFSVVKRQTRETVEVRNAQGEVSHHLQPTQRDDLQNHFYQQQTDVVEKYGNHLNYWNQAPIHCKVQKERSIYLAATGHVLPCCWLGGELAAASANLQPLSTLLATLPNQADSLSGHHFSLHEIIEGEFFQSLLPASWQKSSLAQGKLHTCARICGVEARPFESQFL
jgi:MoaA/NifB/PqqE/SkfB family radical SAM enzyme